MLTKRFLLLGVLLTVAGCAVQDQNTPSLTGPSELGLSLVVSADRDVVNQDGKSVANITVVARDGYSQPKAGVLLRVGIEVDGRAVDYGQLNSREVQTDASGVARVQYTAPAEPPPTVGTDTIVTIAVTPLGSDYMGATTRTVQLRLVRPGVIEAPSSDLKPAFTFSPSTPRVGDSIVFDASTSTAGTRTITSYRWSLGDGLPGPSGKMVNNRYEVAGSYTVMLTITDDLGRTASTTQVVAVGQNLPKADFVFTPTDPAPGQNVIFNSAVSTAGVGRRIVSYTWYFSWNGDTRTGVTADYTFTTENTYTVVLTVTDDIGQTNSISKTVSVKIPGASSESK